MELSGKMQIEKDYRLKCCHLTGQISYGSSFRLMKESDLL
jgi:hypothetical protein